MRMVAETMLVGFLIGLVIASSAQWLGLTFPMDTLSLLPFYAALLSGLGTVVATGVTARLTHASRPYAQIAGFLAAALVNAGLAYGLLTLHGTTALSPYILIILFSGLALGGLYGLYADRRAKDRERLEMLETLAEKNREIEKTTRLLTLSEERRRMSRELHDGISQGIHGMLFSIATLERTLEPLGEKERDLLDHLKETAENTRDELKNVLEALAPGMLEDHTLTEALHLLLDGLEKRSDLKIERKIDPIQGLDPHLELSLYRIAQEAIANVERHAQAKRVSFLLTYEQDVVRLEIRDDGMGFDTEMQYAGHGLSNLQARANEIEAHLTIKSRPNQGTLVELEIHPS